MPEQIPIARTLRIRDCGFDEYWLQDQIWQNPSSLGLGNLEGLSKERTQSSGGRVDLLLKNPDDDSMYEVEVMLGATDEEHIIRTIEYWDNEKRRWPQRQHYAVLVAESVTRRFFNVIHLLGQSIPIIAIQANLIEAGSGKILNFIKILDVYEEPEDPSAVMNEPSNEDDWRQKAPWTLESAQALLQIVRPIYGEATLNYTKQYIPLKVKQNNYFSLVKRGADKTILKFRVSDEDKNKVKTLLDEADIGIVKETRSIRIMVDKQLILGNSERFKTIAEFVRKYWEE